MKRIGSSMTPAWTRLGPAFLPFADAATDELPLGRLLRLSLFQVSVGLSSVLLIGTLNRVMIVELGVAAWLVATMVSLPLVFAPLRAFIGHRSDNHNSALGWRRVPYIWIGTLVQFGGLAIMPFALILLSGDSNAAPIVGQLGAAMAFLMVGAGLHTTQTVGLALATDLAPAEAQPRVVALLSFMLLIGMVVGAVGFGMLLRDFSQMRLIQVIQGAAMVTLVLNCIALWKQEARNPNRGRHGRKLPNFTEAWGALRGQGRWLRRLVAIGLGSAAFSMQDILLEPYGGQILGLSVAATTTLTSLFAGGGIAGFAVAARGLGRGFDAHRIAAFGALSGAIGFAAIIFAAPLDGPVLFGLGTVAIGFGSGLFTVGTLTACMELAPTGQSGIAVGAWGAVQASCAGAAIAIGGILRDVVSHFAIKGLFGPALVGAATGYGAVYLLEIVLLFATIAVIGPLVRSTSVPEIRQPSRLGFAGSLD